VVLDAPDGCGDAALTDEGDARGLHAAAPAIIGAPASR